MKSIRLMFLSFLLAAGCATRHEPGSVTNSVATPTATPEAPAEQVITDFPNAVGVDGWQVEDDGVMGGLSKGSFSINQEGLGIFSGNVTLENNGGFSSVQRYFDPIDVSAFRSVCLRVKGDGKQYQFIVEAEKNAWHYYVHEFLAGEEWQTVEIPLADMYPVRRGDRLGLPNFPGETLSQVRFLIGNGVAEPFRLEIEKIWLK